MIFIITLGLVLSATLFWEVSFGDRCRSGALPELWRLLQFFGRYFHQSPSLTHTFANPLLRSDVNWANFPFGGVVRYHWAPFTLPSAFALWRSLYGIQTCFLFDDIGDDASYVEFFFRCMACVNLISLHWVTSELTKFVLYRRSLLRT